MFKTTYTYKTHIEWPRRQCTGTNKQTHDESS